MTAGGNAKEGSGEEKVGLLVILVQRMFGDRALLKEFAWEKIVLTLKEKGEFWGIEIVKETWKVCTSMVNCRLERRFVFHDALHRLIEGWGTGMSTLEANLYQQLAGLAHEPLFQVFLEISKAYDSLEMVHYLDML